jgi:hypothetical protein
MKFPNDENYTDICLHHDQREPTPYSSMRADKWSPINSFFAELNDTSKFWLPGFPILQLFASFGFIYSSTHSSHFCIVLCPQRIIECPPAKQTHSKHLFQRKNMTTYISELFILLAQQVLDEKKNSKASQK